MDIKRESLLNALDNPLTSDEEWEELLADEDNVLRKKRFWSLMQRRLG